MLSGFITIYFYLQGFIFVCCYACFLLNNSYFFNWFFIFVFASFLFSRAIDEEASSRQVFPPFVVMHVCFIIICFYLQGFIFVCCYACFFFLIIVIFSYWFFNSVFGSFLFSQAIKEEAFSRLIFFPFAVMHVCFVIVCFYLQGYNFVCCYPCFFLN